MIDRLLLAVLCTLACVAPVAAQPWPSQPIRLIAPFPPGGSVDILARFIADPLAAQLGTRVIIDNRSGASGNIGMEAAARAAPDGYTIVLNTIPLATNKSLFDKLAWDPVRDFAAIGMVATSPHVVVVAPKLSANSIAEMLRLARAKPGALSYSSAGVGSTFHLCGEMFKDATQTFILHVPYRGGGPAVQDLLAGQVDLSFPTLATALPHIRAGTLRALAVTGTARTPLLPEVPTLQEAGVKGFQFTQWQALLAPAGTPAPVIARLNAALRAAVATREVREKFEAAVFEPYMTTPDEAARFVAGEVERFSALIKSRRITAD